uniref:RNA-directed DNA polymerase n=1 Tax=Cannabis sativa TaxID=3483 RepID=A0A803PBL9_CANSA
MGPKKDPRMEQFDEKMEAMSFEFNKALTEIQNQLGKEIASFVASWERDFRWKSELESEIHSHGVVNGPMDSIPSHGKDAEVRFPPSPPPQNTFPPQPPPHPNPYYHGQPPATNFRPPRMELPVFSGDNPEGWILPGRTRRPITSWATLKQLLLHRFRVVPIDSLSEEFLSLSQTSTVRDYRLRWEASASRVPAVPEHILEGSFVKGLKDEIKGSLHMLQPKFLQVLLFADEDEPPTDIESPPPSPKAEEPTAVEETLATLSLNSLVGISSAHTMKLAGKIGSLPVTVLIDSGATHNFISREVVEASGVPITQTTGYGILLGTGDRVKAEGVCSQVSLELGEICVVSDFLPLELGGVDVILGVKWLETLGNMQVNWRTMVMRFKRGGTWVTLQGDPSLCKSPITLKAMFHTVAQEGYGFWVQLGALQADTDHDEHQIPAIVEEVLHKYDSVFHMPPGLPPERSCEHCIVLKEGVEPISVRPYRYAQIQKDAIEQMGRNMLQIGIVTPSTSPFSSPVLLVKKKDESWRFCVDYRALNREIVADKFSIPVVDELLDKLYGARVFAKLDLKSGYHQIRMAAKDRAKTAFRTHDGHYEFLVMPFGLTNAPATFQALRNEIFSRSSSANSAEVLRRLQQHKLYANRKKCSFGPLSLEYLGHIISSQGVSADPQKVAAMVQWPVPKSIKELRGFLGLTGYYRNLLWWKQMLRVGLGAVLMQDQRPIAYFSQVLSSRSRSKSVYERELMAIVLAIQKWRPYLLGRKFLVRTDQKSLKYLLEQRLEAAEHQKWLTKVLGYDFLIQYRPGLENKAVDALSRVHTDITYAALSVPNLVAIPDLQTQVPILFKCLKCLRELHQGTESAGSAIGGHSGVFKTFLRVAADLYWPGMRKDVQRFVAECVVCQQNKYIAQTPAGLLQPLPIPHHVWDNISMDFIEGLPMSHRFDSILVVVDRLSKYGHFIPLRHPYTASTVAKVFVRDVVKLHGFPRSIVSDRDKIFLSLFWKELFKLQGTNLKHSTTYHPQSDGQTEVVNRCLETYLRCFVGLKPSKWVKWLAWAEYWYNTSYHVSAGMTPFKALYNRDPPPLLRFEPASTIVSEVEQQLQARASILSLLKENLQQLKEKMKTAR